MATSPVERGWAAAQIFAASGDTHKYWSGDRTRWRLRAPGAVELFFPADDATDRILHNSGSTVTA